MAKRRTVPSLSRPKQYEIIKSSTRDLKDITVGGVKVPLRRHGTLVTDGALARDIEQTYGQDKRAPWRDDVMVVPVDDRNPQHERGHRYSFTVPEMPWKKKANDGNDQDQK